MGHQGLRKGDPPPSGGHERHREEIAMKSISDNMPIHTSEQHLPRLYGPRSDMRTTAGYFCGGFVMHVTKPPFTVQRKIQVLEVCDLIKTSCFEILFITVVLCP